MGLAVCSTLLNILHYGGGIWVWQLKLVFGFNLKCSSSIWMYLVYTLNSDRSDELRYTKILRKTTYPNSSKKACDAFSSPEVHGSLSYFKLMRSRDNEEDADCRARKVLLSCPNLVHFDYNRTSICYHSVQKREVSLNLMVRGSFLVSPE